MALDPAPLDILDAQSSNRGMSSENKYPFCQMASPNGAALLVACMTFHTTFWTSIQAHAAAVTATSNNPSQTETVATSNANTELKIPSGLISLSEEDTLSKYSFVVDKSKRIIEVYSFDKEAAQKETNSTFPFVQKIAEYPTDIGKKMGDKQKENDFRTPVGIYFLQRELTQPEIPYETYGNLAFTTDYPNIFDKRDYKTGSGIWLHAVPDTVPLTRGSRGCVVVRNNVIKSLKQFFKPGQTPILIYDEIKYLTANEHAQQKQKYLTDIENWRTAWEKQDVDTYIQYYDDSFRNDEMNYKQWYKHKRKLKKLYSFIKVQLGKPLILANKDQFVIRVPQKYQSNLHEDYGIKTIHGRLDQATGFKIIREEWIPLDKMPTSTEAIANIQTVKQPTN